MKAGGIKLRRNGCARESASTVPNLLNYGHAKRSSGHLAKTHLKGDEATLGAARTAMYLSFSQKGEEKKNDRNARRTWSGQD